MILGFALGALPDCAVGASNFAAASLLMAAIATGPDVAIADGSPVDDYPPALLLLLVIRS